MHQKLLRKKNPRIQAMKMSSLKDVIKCDCGALIPVFSNRNRVTCRLCGAEYQRVLGTVKSPVLSLRILPKRPLAKHNPKSPVTIESPPVTIRVVDATLDISVSPTEGLLGDTFTFTGFLFIDGYPAEGYTVNLYRNGILVGSDITDFDGMYSIPWVSDVSGVLSFHAETTI